MGESKVATLDTAYMANRVDTPAYWQVGILWVELGEPAATRTLLLEGRPMIAHPERAAGVFARVGMHLVDRPDTLRGPGGRWLGAVLTPRGTPRLRSRRGGPRGWGAAGPHIQATPEEEMSRGRDDRIGGDERWRRR
jgi:hypothetical protein